MTKEEKVLILGALFHDIGKFEQRCTGEKVKHEQLGVRFISEFEEDFVNILGDLDSVKKVKEIVGNHHKENTDILVNLVKEADHLSASERVEFDEPNGDNFEKWSHKYLSSLFSKIYLNNPNDKNLRYYEQKLLTENEYDTLIPKYESEKELKLNGEKYNSETFKNFKKQIQSILQFYNDDSDFFTFINLLLILFEKYMWVIPDFTGSEQTDISLYNHSKDVAGLAHAIYKSESENLNLIIGDLPGIQNYIFNVANKKPAKILRGRSIFVQILTQQFATILLNKLGYTTANIIMLAGGKFYIISDNAVDFEHRYNSAKLEIENYLIDNFNYQLSFSSSYETFNYKNLKDKKNNLTFGELIDRASYKLLEKRNQQFSNKLFDISSFNENNFILEKDYINISNNEITDKIKCAVTDLPIKNGREKLIDEGLLVDKQIFNEISIGEKIPKSNVIIEFDDKYTEVINVKNVIDYKNKNAAKKFIINPDLEELLKPENIVKDILRNSQLLVVANYTTKDSANNNIVMDFEEMEEKNNGAKFMTLIKGDIDNLGLIMSSGLVDDNQNYTAISRTTTLSNQLKYFFSYSLNNFLESWEKGVILKTVNDDFVEDQKSYTVFAGGDDLMLICPQSSSLKLVNAFNKLFNQFVCENPEIHISYSLTNFKHNTPIRIVADIAEENQEKSKYSNKANKKSGNENTFIVNRLSTEKDIFYAEKNKACIRLFNTNINTCIIDYLIKLKKDITKWENDEKNKVTQGTLRNLLQISKIIQDYNSSGDTRFLMWHPKLNYMINRNLKKSDNTYINPEVENFFETALLINKQDTEAKKLEKVLYPLICEVLYATRNS